MIQRLLIGLGLAGFAVASPGLLHGGGGGATGHAAAGLATSYVSFGGGHGGSSAPGPVHLGPAHIAPVHISGGHGYAAHAPEPVAYPKYVFMYGVHDAHTGDVKDAKEERDGDVVKGEYSLLQPDGTKRTVHYTADKHAGFNAVVSVSGHAVHPDTKVVHEAVGKPLLAVGGHGSHGGHGGHGGYGGHGGATSYVSGGLIAHAAHTAAGHHY